MNQNFNNFSNFDSNTQTRQSLSLGKYTGKVFGWMCIGLMITFITSVIMAFSGLTLVLFSSAAISIGLMIAQLAVVFSLSLGINKISAKTATVLFLSYSLLTGITFSGLFYTYGVSSVIGVFFLTSLYFGALAAFGLFTKADLSKMGPFLSISIVFLIIGSLITMIFPMAMFDKLLCIGGLIVFLACTAYDTQKIATYYHSFQGDEAMLGKAAIISALQLYLDFINIFIYLLRLFASNKD